MIKLVSDKTTGQLSAKGKIELDATLETPIFLSLFGGNVEGITTNERKPSGVENPDWFGNLYLQEIKKPFFNSKFEKCLKENPITSGNLTTLKQKALEDLEWIVKTKSVKSFDVVFEIIGSNAIKIDITANKPNNVKSEYSYLWSK